MKISFKKIFVGIILMIGFFYSNNYAMGGDILEYTKMSSPDDWETPGMFDEDLMSLVDRGAISVNDDNSVSVAKKNIVQRSFEAAADWAYEELYQKTLKEGAASAFWAAARQALNTFAYDTATWIGSGNKGQKPLYVTEGWDTYLNNIGDNAAGRFIEDLGRYGPVKFNLCTPSFGVKNKIGLGLANLQRPKTPSCTYTKMKENWSEALDDENFLVNFQDMFNPGSNDIGIALSLQTSFLETKRVEEDLGLNELFSKKGWIDVRDAAGSIVGAPVYNEVERRYDKIAATDSELATQFTGTLFDAVNIFLNQLAATSFNQLMNKLAGKSVSSPHSGEYPWLKDPDASPSRGGIKEVEDQFKKLVEPNFKERGDYDILAELSTCDTGKTPVGPTNCVIQENFRQAIAERKTVGQALVDGNLNSKGVFGFFSGVEPRQENQHYPYRSMIILRKFRIVPVGWEVAAQYIRDNESSVGNCTIGDMLACYDDKAEEKYSGYTSSDCNVGSGWCTGLVDPDWLLKAPKNYCAKEGYGNEFLAIRHDGDSYNVSRDSDYCADEQTCIKENDKGNCDVYGYCIEERGGWDFKSDSCDPLYNTCQNYQNTKNRKKVSYLENTLDFCDASGAGCLEYCTNYEYGTDSWLCDLYSVGDKMYLNDQANDCDSDEEGCHELVRVKAGFGTNLLKNSSFEDLELGALNDSGNWGTSNNMDIVDEAYLGNQALSIDSVTLNHSVIINANNFEIGGSAFTLSFWAKNCSGGFSLGGADRRIENNDYWERYQVVNAYPENATDNRIGFSISPENNNCIIDGVMLEKTRNINESASEYRDYIEGGIIYEKLLPEYLEDECYRENGGVMEKRANAPVECDNYARKCTYQELNCEMYTSKLDDISIPAKVTAQNYCPAECVGYDMFIQDKTYFEPLKEKYFIPDTARQCDASNVGCSEFTNLDKIEEGGESKEYYSYLRRCQNPDNNCAEFYTWEGSDETGFQLKVYSLAASSGAPDVYDTEFNDFLCNENTYDPDTNPTCREFYNTDGEVYYEFYQYTTSCSDDCHPFRLNNYDIENLAERENDCGFMGGDWRSDIGSCIFMAIPEEGTKCGASAAGCRKYTGNEGSNIMIVGDEIYDFESGAQSWFGGRLSQESSTNVGHSYEAQNRTISVGVGTEVAEGSAYEISFIAKNDGNQNIDLTVDLGGSAFAGVARLRDDGEWNYYTLSLSYLDQAPNNRTRLSISANNGLNYYIDNIVLTERVASHYLIKNSWVTPYSCDHDINDDPSPREMMGCDEYTDRDRTTHYLKDFDQACAESAVGCELMIDTHNLSSSYEEMYWQDAQIVGSCDSNTENDCVHIGADSYIYAVYDEDKSCTAGNKGCEMFGSPYKYDSEVIYSSIYKLNNPDKYSTILCGPDDDGCSAWSGGGGEVYFKDPGDNTCEWKNVVEGANTGYRWVKSAVKRCDMDGNGSVDENDSLCSHGDDCGEFSDDIFAYNSAYTCSNDLECKNAGTYYDQCIDGNCGCSKDSDCANNLSCVQAKCVARCMLDEENNYDCPVEVDASVPIKTFGMGGYGSAVEQPHEGANGQNWTGLCPKTQSSCTEYIDPLSNASPNLIDNPDFSYRVGATPTNWGGNQQVVPLEPYTLYVASVNSVGSASITVNSSPAYMVNSDNQIVNMSANNISDTRILFFTGPDPQSVDHEAVITISSYNNNSFVEIKKAMINYQLQDDMPESDCNGIYRFGEGCIIFNKRSVTGTDTYEPLIYNADAVVDGEAPSGGAPETANTLPLRVEPDRVCSQWLACKTLIKDEDDNNVCYNIGLCDSFNELNECDNWINIDEENQEYRNGLESKIKNLSGYSKVGYDDSGYFGAYKLPNNLYNLSAMSQEDNPLKLDNGGFEYAGLNSYPIGWIFDGGEGVTRKKVGTSYEWVSSDEEFAETDDIVIGWDESVFKVVRTPSDAADQGICYRNKPNDDTCGLFNPEGRGFLALGAPFNATSENIKVPRGAEYTISAYVNTKMLTAGVAHISIVNGDSEIEEVKLLLGGATTTFLVYDILDRINIDNTTDARIDILSAQDWIRVQGSFEIPIGVDQIKIHINATSDQGVAQGKVFVDDIKIKPVLRAHEVSTNVYYNIPQTCRLYGDSDALSCDYYDEQGVKIKGMNGYCLEYDRPPGDPNTCILWYPVDKLKGEGIEEGVGYSGRYPLYYCSSVDMNFTLVEPRSTAYINKKTIRTSLFDQWYDIFLTVATGGYYLIYAVPDYVLELIDMELSPNRVDNYFSLVTRLTKDSFGQSVSDGEIVVINEEPKGDYKNCFGSGCGVCPYGYYYYYTKDTSTNIGSSKITIREYCKPNRDDFVTVTQEDGQRIEWYKYNGDLQRVGGRGYAGCWEKNNDARIDTECDENKDDKPDTYEDWAKVKDYRIKDVSDELGLVREIDDPIRVYYHNTRELLPFDEANRMNRLMNCSTIVNTVTATGDNKAWYPRVNSRSEYESKTNAKSTFASFNDIINKKYNSPNKPYGAIGYVYPQNNPYEWDGNFNTSIKDPINIGYNQVGGIAYSCVGASCGVLGVCSREGNNCLATSLLNYITSKGIAGHREGNDNNFDPYAILNLPREYSCDVDEVCIPVSTEEREDSKNVLKRLYAENYGTWKWEENFGQCESGPFHGYQCKANDDCRSQECTPYCVGWRSVDTLDPDDYEYTVQNGINSFGTPCDPNQNYMADTNNDGIDEVVYSDCLGQNEGYCGGRCVGNPEKNGRLCISDKECMNDNGNGSCRIQCIGGYNNFRNCEGQNGNLDDSICQDGECTFYQGVCSGRCQNDIVDCTYGDVLSDDGETGSDIVEDGVTIWDNECLSGICRDNGSDDYCFCERNDQCSSGYCDIGLGRCHELCTEDADCDQVETQMGGLVNDVCEKNDSFSKCSGGCTNGMNCSDSADCDPYLYSGPGDVCENLQMCQGGEYDGVLPPSFSGDPASYPNNTPSCDPQYGASGKDECSTFPENFYKCHDPEDNNPNLGNSPYDQIDPAPWSMRCDRSPGGVCYIDCDIRYDDDTGYDGDEMGRCPRGTTCIASVGSCGDGMDMWERTIHDVHPNYGLCYDNDSVSNNTPRPLVVPCSSYCLGVDFWNNGYLGSHKSKCTNNPRHPTAGWCGTEEARCVYNSTGDSHYQPIDDYWEPPILECNSAIYSRDDTRFDDFDNNIDYCAIPPWISNINYDKSIIQEEGFVNLTFHTDVDIYQLPLVEYIVDWGDDDVTYVSGVEMMDRPYSSNTEENNPHSLFHVYNYYDLLSKDSDNINYPEINCVTGSNPHCRITPRIKIKDNWGWCNNGISGDPCPDGGYHSASEIIVSR